MKEHEVTERLGAALQTLIARDGLLLEYDAGERTTSARLACYLMPLFSMHDVDVEYNRHGLDPKVVPLPPECRGGGERQIVPDIIVHRRGTDDQNLLAIEVKKDTNPEPRECDRAKILAMKPELRYSYGVLLDIPAGRGAVERQIQQEWL